MDIQQLNATPGGWGFAPGANTFVIDTAIQQARARGYSDDEIRQALWRDGWRDPSVVDEAFARTPPAGATTAPATAIGLLKRYWWVVALVVLGVIAYRRRWFRAVPVVGPVVSA